MTLKRCSGLHFSDGLVGRLVPPRPGITGEELREKERECFVPVNATCFHKHTQFMPASYSRDEESSNELTHFPEIIRKIAEEDSLWAENKVPEVFSV